MTQKKITAIAEKEKSEVRELPAWAELPNAKYIDLIIAELKKNLAVWQSAARNPARDAARNAASDEAREEAMAAVSNAIRNPARDADWNPARDALLALIAYDDCAHLLDAKPEDVLVFALLGQPAAVLLYPIVLALHRHDLIKTKKK